MGEKQEQYSKMFVAYSSPIHHGKWYEHCSLFSIEEEDVSVLNILHYNL